MMKLGLKSRSRRVVQDSSMAVEKSKIFTGKNKSDSDESCSYFCWASLPPELLREVLMKLEESESKWPARKHVVACAGVCKSWREVMKDVVKTPEASGKITFPISVKQAASSLYPTLRRVVGHTVSGSINKKEIKLIEEYYNDWLDQHDDDDLFVAITGFHVKMIVRHWVPLYSIPGDM